MKNPDKAIDRVLAGLRDSDAPAGLERRVLEAIENTASVREQSGWFSLRSLIPSPPTTTYAACGATFAALFVVALAIPMFRRPGHTSAPATYRASPQQAMVSRPQPSTSPRAPLARRANTRPIAVVPAAAHPVARNNDDAARDSNAVALEETRAASHPAPPFPLTEQERMLARMVHRGRPVELAELNPAVRAKQNEQENEEFEKFFEPPKTGESE